MAAPITLIFSRMNDPRKDRGRRHALTDILVIALLAILCGGNTWTDMEDFGNARKQWLNKFLTLRHGVPSADTFAAVFAALDPDQFEACFRTWTLAVAGAIVGVLAIDGKTMRGSGDKAVGTALVHMVSAWAVDNNVVFGQIATREKSNEITAIPELLALLNIKGLIVTIDAMGCQKNIAKQIVEQGGDYVLQVKDNQPELRKGIEDLFQWSQQRGFDGLKHASCESTDKGHGRIEHRKADVLWDLRQILQAPQWAGLRAVVRVQCTRTIMEYAPAEKSSTQQTPAEKIITQKTSTENHYYITSVATNRAEELARACRGHWGVENGLHWCLDVNFGEDHNQTSVRDAAQNLSRLKRMALNLLKLDTSKKISLRRKRFIASLDSEYLVLLFAKLALLPA